MARVNKTVLGIATLAVMVSAHSALGQAGQAPAPPGPGKPPATPVKSDPMSRALRFTPWTGDFDGMVKRRMVRILTPYSRTSYFVDKGVQLGAVYDAGVKLETELNLKLKTTNANHLHVVFIPTSRDALYQSLVEGKGDIIAAGITVTPERAALVDFSIPTRKDVKEIVVTGPGAPPIATIDDLAGKTVAVRDKSIQFESLQKLNETFKQQGKAAVTIQTVPTSLEDEDILEMANAGLLKIVVVDDYLGSFWTQVLPSITLHPTVTVRSDGDLAWAVRKNSPKLIAEVNAVIAKNGQGTLFGNLLLTKYLKNVRYVKSATSPERIKQFNDLIATFRKYGDKYGMDYLLVMAQGFQESRLDQSVKSRVGAVGVMQVMPATGKEMAVGDIRQIDGNINAGVKYIRFMIDQYYKDEPMDDLNKGLFAFASYNAGPARIRGLRKEAAARGLNPNVWLNNVERIAAERIGRETVTYVSNIYKYYIAYTLVQQEEAEKAKTKAAVGGGR